MISHHADIILEVLTNNGFRGVLQQWCQTLHHNILRQLGWRPNVIMSDRHIRSFTCLTAKRDTNKPGFHVIDAGGFRVESEGFRCLQHLDPAIQRFQGKNNLIFTGNIIRRRHIDFLPIQLSYPGPELVFLKSLEQSARIGRGHHQFLNGMRQRYIGPDGGKVIRHR